MNNIMIIKELNNNIGMCAHAKSSIYIQYTHIYIYTLGAPGFRKGWGGAGHVNVMFMLHCCYVDGRGGVGWVMLASCSCYVDATLMGGVGWGGVGHVNVMFMLRCCYVDGRGGVGWGMLASCSCYVDATLIGVGCGMLASCSCYVVATLMGGWGGAWWGGAC